VPEKEEANSYANSHTASNCSIFRLHVAHATLVAQPAEITFDHQIEKGRVAQNKRLIRVKQGDAIRLRWTSDRVIMLHLHGYDIETKVEPGTTAEMAFTARATGRFPVEEPQAQGACALDRNRRDREGTRARHFRI
jgi:hypothetical protein